MVTPPRRQTEDENRNFDLVLSVSLEEFYGIALRQCVESAHSYKSTLEAEATNVPVQTSVTLEIYEDDAQTLKGLREYFLDIVKQFPAHEQATLTYMHGMLDKESGVLDRIKQAKNGGDAVAAYNTLAQLKLKASGGDGTEPGHSRFSLAGEDRKILLRLVPDAEVSAFGKRVDAAVKDAAEHKEFYGCVMQLLDELRDRKSRPTSAETFAIALSSAYLRKGIQQPRLFKPLSLPGRHKRHQSFVFVTDAGPDHIKITAQDRSMLDHGIVVHIEHIDRSETGDRSLMEAYRLPSHITAARVRQHVGDLAPTSCFIGRPTFEGLSFNAQYPHDMSGNAFGTLARQYCEAGQAAHDPDYFFNAALLKAAHQTASACSAMFEAGIVDAKIAIENMTEQQAIRFMNAVVANVRRDPDRQYLSAAFNINRPIFSESRGKLLQRTDPDGTTAIAKAAVQITRQGNFDKVTLDGASERKGASVPVVDQLSHPQMLGFVHEAHQAGLITYLSAGIDASNLHKAVYTGVDGMGIGFALHAQNPDKAGVIAALSVKKINEILEKRDQAEGHLFGRAAKVLAHLDYASFEGSLSSEQEQLREKLFDTLNKPRIEDIVENDVKALLDELEDASVAAPDENHKVYSHVAQLLDNDACTLGRFLPPGWQKDLHQMKMEHNVAGLRLILSSAQEKRHEAESAPPPQDMSKAGPAAPENAAPLTSAAGTSEDEQSWVKLAELTAASTDPKSAQPIKHHAVYEGSDLSGKDAGELLKTASGKVFVGVKDFPEGVTEAELLRRGAIVVKPARYMPFRVGRDTLYTARELLDNDANIYNWYKHFDHDTYDNIMMALHDGVILNLLQEEYACRKQVGIMGGHAMLRDSGEYREIALLCRALALKEFVVATGGGPGAMEAANLGAHFSGYSEDELLEAIDILKEKPSYQDDPDNLLARKILQRWPQPSPCSLGIPTWLYGHEPPNLFCKYQAKFFSNAVREDVLVLTCNCGIIFTPGSAGTRTEIAQFAVSATYSKETGSDFSKPMIFYGNFWTENT
ncbi:LOG family protein, partial [Desulfobacter sp.]|uniref:LOG family protein n=1 Tax=Desulfobacter sp. TaxID=2294 RepID=UPI003D1034BC